MALTKLYMEVEGNITECTVHDEHSLKNARKAGFSSMAEILEKKNASNKKSNTSTESKGTEKAREGSKAISEEEKEIARKAKNAKKARERRAKLKQ